MAHWLRYPLLDAESIRRRQDAVANDCPVYAGQLGYGPNPKLQQRVRDADLIVSSVTLAFDLEPFVDAGWLKPGAFAAVTDAGVGQVGSDDQDPHG